MLNPESLFSNLFPSFYLWLFDNFCPKKTSFLVFLMGSGEYVFSTYKIRIETRIKPVPVKGTYFCVKGTYFSVRKYVFFP